MKRRDFIILTGIGGAGATVLTSCGHPEDRLIPALIPDDNYVPGLDYWKTSTCSMCSARCGITVRTREYKANKIEGNPEHPVNRGSLCARGQAGLQVLYNPDRVQHPLKQAGDRGSDRFVQISWDEAIATLAGRLKKIKEEGNANSVVFATDGSNSVSALAAEGLLSAYGSQAPLVMAGAALREQTERMSYQESYGTAALPVFDIANATYILSFGARFLETWHSPVKYALAFSDFRKAKARVGGKFVQIEPRMSLTAANADEWIPAAAGVEGVLALGIAHVIIREGLAVGANAPGFLKEPLENFAPETMAERTGVPAERLIGLAKEFVAAERPLAIGGGVAAAGPLGLDSLKAINFLNTLVGNVGKSGGVLAPKGAFDPFAKLRDSKVSPAMSLPDLLENVKVNALLIHGANIVHCTPSAADRIRAIPFVVSFSPFLDETAQLADLILPDHTYLESWDLSVTQPDGSAVAVSPTIPLVNPEFDTRQTADVMVALAAELGETLPFASAEEAVKQSAGELRKLSGSIQAETDEDFWTAFAEKGVWTGQPAVSPSAANVKLAEEPSQSGSGEQKLTLLAYEHAALGFGDFANLPWLQEMPDPMTSVMWGSWVEINPATAAGLGIRDGDLVEVRSQHGAVQAPAVLYPAIHPDVVAMPFGQGHSALGRYAKGKGVNPAALDLRSPGAGPREIIVRVNVSKLSSGSRIARFGTSLPEHLEMKR